MQKPHTLSPYVFFLNTARKLELCKIVMVNEYYNYAYILFIKELNHALDEKDLHYPHLFSVTFFLPVSFIFHD